MEIPPPDPAKLLASWMEWERGDVTPGRVMANLKTGGLRELLEGLAREEGALAVSTGTDGSGPGQAAGEASQPWAPVV